MSVKIIVDSGCDIIPLEAENLGVEIIPLKTRFGDREYLDGVTLTSERFYEMLVESEELPKTSQITPDEYSAEFEKIRKSGDSAVCITISSRLSGCFQSANIAAEDYPEISVVDSESVCIGERVLVLYALSLVKEGLSPSEIAERLDKEKKRIKVIDILETREYLNRGG